jgi:hypothetical protein
MEAGNSLEQSVALVAAANRVVQDPNSVGSALRTISLRLRGTSVEVLEELGEETDGAVESVSKMQEKLKALTGVDILTDSGAYKDTYTILKDIAEVWDDMSNMDQAAALELMAGKNRANTLAAILNNMKDLEGAYESALNAEGSAMRENEAYLDSIQGRIDLFSNALQTFWMNLLNTDVIKGVVDVGTALLKFADTFIGKLTAIAAGFMIFEKVKNGVKFADMFAGGIKVITSIIGLTKSMTVATASQTIASKISNKEIARSILITSGLSTAEGTLTKELVASAAAMLTNEFQLGKLTTQEYIATMSTMGLKTAIQALWNVLLKNPFFLVSAAVAALAVAFDYFNTTAQEAADEAKEAFDEIQSIVESTKSTIQSLESELSTLQEKIDAFDGKSLSFADQEELDRLKRQRAELEHSLKVQQQLLDLQTESKNKQAVASMEAYTKAASQGAEKTQNAWKTALTTIGVAAGTIAGAVFTGGASLGVQIAGAAAGAAGFGLLGNKAGEYAGSKVSENDGTYDSWYETYTKAIETARADEEKALEKYQKDPDNIKKLDAWREAQQKTIDIETEMYDHLSQMQQYYNGLEYGQSEEIDNKLNEWYNFLDKMSIDKDAPGAKTTALDRIFGEHADKEIQGIKEQILNAAKSGEEFDFEAAINSSEELKNVLSYLGLTVEDVRDYFVQVGKAAANVSSQVTPIKAYTDLLADAERYNEILQQTSEIVSDNTKVSQEYKDSLSALGLSQEELNECFDDQNPLIVKNSDLLNDLVKSSKKNISQNVKLAKSQARLKYYELYKQMRSLTNGRKVENAATLAQVNAIYQEMSALQKVIAKYSLLEHKLLGATNAYEKLAEAQEIDAAIDYGSKAEEMVTVLANAFNTAELGTEAAQVAISGLVPDSVIDKAKSLDEQMKQIYSYFTSGSMSKLFTIEFDGDGGISSVEMTQENIEKFTKSLIGSAEEGAVFQGTWDEFSLNPAITSLEEFADACGLTKEIAFAFLTSLEKYDISWLGGDGTTLLDQLMGDDFEYQAQKNIEALAELEHQMANGQITVDEYISKYTELSAAQDENNQKIRENATAWADTTEQVNSAKQRVEELTNEINSMRESGASDAEIQVKVTQLKHASEVLSDALQKKYDLQEPTEMTLQIVLDDIQAQIDQWKANNAELVVDVVPKLVQDENGKWTIPADVQATLDESEKSKIQEYLDLANDQYTITVLADENPNDSTAELNEVKTVAEAVQQAIENIPDPEINTSAAQSAVNALKVTVQSLINKLGEVPSDVYTTIHETTITTTQTSGTDSANGTVHLSGIAHAHGTAHKSGSWGAPKTETSLVGELGPELLVRGNRWTTIGEHGAEFTQVKKGDIIFNHKQTEDLLSKGYITGRGKLKGGSAFASGTAYAGINTWDDVYDTVHKDYNNIGDSVSDAADEFREVFDWIAVRLEEISKEVSFKSARLENTIGSSKQNQVVDDIIELNEALYDNLIAGANKYYEYAGSLLSKIPAQYRKAAQDGTIAIETFVGEADEETLKAIQDFREWVQKGDDAVQQAEEIITEVSALAKQAIDNIATDFENQSSLNNNKIDQLEAYNALLETQYGSESGNIYKEIIKETNDSIKALKSQRDQMQAELNRQVQDGNIQKYSQDWYDAVNDIAAVDTEIINLTADTYDYQDSINELHWDAFDNVISRLEAISDEASNIIDVLSNKDLVDDDGKWTDEGITSLGLYAQQMEVAEIQASKYREEIDYLNKNWKSLGYTEQEYTEKLEELTSNQYDAIKSYHDAKDAIKDLTSERIEAIKKGIEKEIDAYEKLINKKKEALSAEKEAFDFQRSIEESTKEISKIERQIAALSADQSATARAKRAQLQAELAKAQQELQDKYYEQSIQDQQNALDKELEHFQEEKDKEIEGWEEYLENTEQVVADGLATVKGNTEVVYQTLQNMGQEYSLIMSDALTSPWLDGELAIQNFSEKFGLSMSFTVEELKKVADEHKKIMDQIDEHGSKVVEQVNNSSEKYQEANNPSVPKFDPPETVVKQPTPNNKYDVGSSSSSNTSTSSNAGLISGLSAWLKEGNSGSDVRNLQKALNDLGFNAGSVDGIFGYNTKQAVMRFQSSSKYGGAIPADGIVGPDTKKKFKTAGYARGTTGVKKNQLSIIDELGDELVMHADGSGRLAYLSKGSAVIPHDISENLMKLGQLDPQNILDQNRPVISAPHITNNNVELNVSFGEVVHIDHVDNAAVPNLAKTVEKQIDKYMKGLNSEIRKYVR